MQTITTRPATLADLDTLRRFEQGVIYAERPFDQTIKPDPVNYYNLHEMITADHITLLIAEVDGEPAGSGYARIQASKLFLIPQQHCYLGFMYVEPQHRGKGINNHIMNGLKQWAVNQGINELQLEVYYQNEPAIRAYEKAGFSRNMIQMRMEV